MRLRSGGGLRLEQLGARARALEAADLRAVVFDLNGVLTRPPSRLGRRRLLRVAGVDAATFERLYWRHRPSYDRGEVDSAGYWRRIGRDAGRCYDDARVRALVNADAASWARPNRPMVDALLSLGAAGVRTAILSNTPREIWAHVSATHSWVRAPDVLALSFELGMSKPDPALFRICLERLCAAPAETLLVDDRDENVEIACTLGIRAVRYRSERFKGRRPSRRVIAA